MNDIHVFARDPVEMAKSQVALVEWTEGKIKSLSADLLEATENFKIAKKNKWRSQPFARMVTKYRNGVVFYQKVRAALKAGYYIVPPFPVDIFAIRTDKKTPKRNQQKSTWGWPNVPEQIAKKLPEGEGRYVSSIAEPNFDSMKVTKDGKEVTQYYGWAEEFAEVDFPFHAAKPEVLNKTAEAMGLGVFDQLGVLPRFTRRGDPIVVGQILDYRPTREPLTFFVAWWLNTEEL